LWILSTKDQKNAEWFYISMWITHAFVAISTTFHISFAWSGALITSATAELLLCLHRGWAITAWTPPRHWACVVCCQPTLPYSPLVRLPFLAELLREVGHLLGRCVELAIALRRLQLHHNADFAP